MEKRIAQINEEIRSLAQELEGEVTEERMAEIEARQAELETELKAEKEVEARKANLAQKLVPVEEVKEERNVENTIESRAAEFKSNKGGAMEMRALLISGNKVATPTGVGGINDPEDGNGGLLDLITVTDCTGMGSYKVGYQIDDGAAAAVTEGQSIGGTEADFGFVTITPSDMGVINYVGRDVAKQSPLNYQAKVQAATKKAVQAKARKTVIDAIIASSLNTTKTLATIDKDSIDEIILSYAGDETVAGDAYLILNKTVLKRLAAVKGKNEYLPVFNILPDAGKTSMGTIKVSNGLQARYCLDKNVPDGKIIFGNPKCAELALFGDMEVAVSEEAAFTSNLLTVRGIASVGADVTVYHGFEYITITA